MGTTQYSFWYRIMLVYNVTVDGVSICREKDESVLREVMDFLDCQEKGNKITIEVVEMTREEFNGYARSTNVL